ncbi:hypothetical protein JTB14_035320 [Gonioctena quinquepunctata]|nr:hypothetical protein JTB14_035320 [Gonioctena quinquepunctata]
MTVGQEHFEHEILILPHLAVDVVLGMDVLRARGFQIQLTNNKISLTQNTVPTPVAPSVVTLQHLSTEEESRRSSNSHDKENTGGSRTKHQSACSCHFVEFNVKRKCNFEYVNESSRQERLRLLFFPLCGQPI